MNRLLFSIKQFWTISGVRAAVPGAQQAHADAIGTQEEKIRKLMAIAAALVLLIAGQTPAAAHTRKIHHGRDFAVVYPDHRSGAVCDEEKDGHGVVAQYMTQGGIEVDLDDGEDRNCFSSTTFHSKAIKFRLCEKRGPIPAFCTRWYRP